MATIDISGTEQREVSLEIRDTEDHETLIRLINCEGLNLYIRSILDQGVDLEYFARSEEDDTDDWALGVLALAAGDVNVQEEEEEFNKHPYINIEVSCAVAPTDGDITLTFYGKEDK